MADTNTTNEVDGSDVIVELSEDFYQDPHAVYRVLRRQGPVHHVRMPGGALGWIVLDYDLAREALADTELSKDLQTPLAAAALARAHAENLTPAIPSMMLFTDPPQHTRLRGLVNKAFTGTAIEQLGPRVTQIADELLAALHDGQATDLITAYAFPLPIIVISELLGVPDRDRADFREWSAVLLSDLSTAEQRARAGAGFIGYISDLLVERAMNPREDLVSELVTAAGEDGDRLSQEELIATIVLLLMAGHETTVNLIGNAVAEMLADRDLLDQLCADPDTIPDYLEEVLRGQGPVHFATTRYTTAPIRLGDRDIPAGELIFVSIGAANRDPRRFDAADFLQPDRTPNRHIAFGAGIHYCIGAPLARMEARLALSRLLQRFPHLELDASETELAWRASPIVRGLVELPVRLKSSPTDSGDETRAEAR